MKNGKKGEEGGGILGRVGRGLMGTVMVAAASSLMLMLNPHRCLGQGPVPPDVLPYQGTLVNGDGEPLGTPTPRNYDVIFRIYDDPSGGGLLWAEQQTVTVDAGRFSVQLGAGGVAGTEPHPALITLFRSLTASSRYLETTVKGVGPGRADSTLLPRVRLLPSAYALVTQHALTAERLLNSSNGGVMSVVGKRVGINTTNPTTALEVKGNVRLGSAVVRGDFRAGGTATASSWTGAGAVPVGTVVMWSGSVTERPSGWALCDGSVVNGLRTPDLRGRFVLGAGTGPGRTERRVGDLGGAETVTLSVAELPSHSHFMDPSPMSMSSTGNHSHEISTEAHDTRWQDGGFFETWIAVNNDSSHVSMFRSSVSTGSTGNHDHVLDLTSVQSTTRGEGRPHPNMPPFYVLAYIVRVQ